MPPDPPDNLSSALTRNIRTLEERRADARGVVLTTPKEPGTREPEGGVIPFARFAPFVLFPYPSPKGAKEAKRAKRVEEEVRKNKVEIPHTLQGG